MSLKGLIKSIRAIKIIACGWYTLGSSSDTAGLSILSNREAERSRFSRQKRVTRNKKLALVC